MGSLMYVLGVLTLLGAGIAGVFFNMPIETQHNVGTLAIAALVMGHHMISERK